MKTVIMDLWDSFWSMDWFWRHVAVACTVFVICLTVVFWRAMVPMILLATGVAAYLRYSRAKDGL